MYKNQAKWVCVNKLNTPKNEWKSKVAPLKKNAESVIFMHIIKLTSIIDK